MTHARSLRLILVTLVALGLSLLSEPLALAAAPTNDNIANATVVAEPLPFTDSVNTADAMTDPSDPTTSCFGENSHSVWYAFTPSSSGWVKADTSNSDFFSVLSVWTGTAGNLSEVDCDYGALVVNATASSTYYLMVGSFDSVGGNLELTVEPTNPPLFIESLALDRTQKVDPKTGLAVISGTVTCSGGPDIVEFDVSLGQRIGRIIISGFGFGDVECSGATRWSIFVGGNNGLFVAGKGKVSIDANGRNNEVFFNGTVKLSGGLK